MIKAAEDVHYQPLEYVFQQQIDVKHRLLLLADKILKNM